MMIQQYNQARILRRFQPRAYVMSSEHAGASSILQSITLRLAAEAMLYDADARYQLALLVLATALTEVSSSAAPAWTVAPASGDAPLLYHLTPLQAHAISSSAAWEMIEALRRQADVAAAEPTFATPRDGRRA